MVEDARTALVLEDEPVVLAVFQAVLQRNGFVVLAAERGKAPFDAQATADCELISSLRTLPFPEVLGPTWFSR